MISKRTLIKWRKEALQHKGSYPVVFIRKDFLPEDYVDKVLKLTQELIDQQLIKEK